jgi:hypothetical protein
VSWSASPLGVSIRRPLGAIKRQVRRDMAATREEIQERVKEVLVEQLGIDGAQIT